jgi:hypothetical protein
MNEREMLERCDGLAFLPSDDDDGGTEISYMTNLLKERLRYQLQVILGIMFVF